MQVLNTNKTSAELLLPIKEDYIIEVKATTDGGDGTSSEQIRIPRITSKSVEVSVSIPSISYEPARESLFAHTPPRLFSFFSYCVLCLNAEKVLEYEKWGKEEFLKSAAK